MERTYSCKLRSLAACTRAARLLPLRYSGPSALSCPLFTLLPRRKILRRRPKAPRCSLMAAFLISDNACYPASWRVAFTCEALKTVAINRTQVLVLSFFGLVWTSLVILFVAAPEVYGRALGALVSPREAPLPRGDLGLHCLTRDGRDPTLALDVLANLGGFRLRAASRSGLRPGARWGAPRGRTDLVRAVSGAPRGAAVRRSPVHAGRLPARWDVGGVLTATTSSLPT